MKTTIYNFLKILKNRFFRKYYEKILLFFNKKKFFYYENLTTKINLEIIFNDKDIEKKFLNDYEKIKRLEIPELAGGVNPGDQKAIYFLINSLKPKKVLEIGTHIGSSTTGIALAMSNNFDFGQSYLKTVDLRDVNDESSKPWLQYNSKNSPKKNIKILGLEKLVSFKVSDSINFFYNEKEKYDFIFLDGSHRADYVYNEISSSLKILNTNGIILLHDYFPFGKKLWDKREAIFGPYEGVKKICNENPTIKCMPFGNLPWQTKLNSNISSLAIIYKEKNL